MRHLLCHPCSVASVGGSGRIIAWHGDWMGDGRPDWHRCRGCIGLRGTTTSKRDRLLQANGVASRLRLWKCLGRLEEGRHSMSAPIACTLPAPEMRDRLAYISEFAQRALLRHEQDGGTLRLRYAVESADELERLVEQERSCCPFLGFDLVRRPDAVYLVITTPVGVETSALGLTAHFVGNVSPQFTDCGPACGCGVVS